MSMSTGKAQQYVVGAMATAGVIAAGSALADGARPSARAVVGFAGTCLGLGVATLWAPDLAAAMATLVLVATAFVNGQPLWDAIAGFTNPKTRSSSTTSTTPKGPIAA